MKSLALTLLLAVASSSSAQAANLVCEGSFLSVEFGRYTQEKTDVKVGVAIGEPYYLQYPQSEYDVQPVYSDDTESQAVGGAFVLKASERPNSMIKLKTIVIHWFGEDPKGMPATIYIEFDGGKSHFETAYCSVL